MLSQHRSLGAFASPLFRPKIIRSQVLPVGTRAYAVHAKAKARGTSVAPTQKNPRLQKGSVGKMTPFQTASNEKQNSTAWSRSKTKEFNKERTRASVRKVATSWQRLEKSRWKPKANTLQHLKDPLALADYVKSGLKKGKEEEMFTLVRAATSATGGTIVSWNHLIDYQFSLGRVNAAMKTYNEMKKRAQMPDSHTYVIVLRGLANHAHYPQAIHKAQSVYHSMNAPNSRVKPSIIHTNAVLKVCARGNDMDALWGIASRIPESGAGAADNITYTTIINAIRQSALIDTPDGVSEGRVVARRNQAVMEGRQLWEDVVTRWRTGDIFVDEDLVCSLGRLLLIGTRPRDWDAVFSLVQQATGVPRLRERIDASSSSGESNITPEAGEDFPVVSLDTKVGGGTTLAYAKPSNSTLSLLLEAATRTGSNKVAQEYWNLLTDRDTYAIEPDLNNVNMLLRALRLSRSSAAVRDILESEIFRKLPRISKGTGRIAIAACSRDIKNPNVFENATRILAALMAKMPDPDPATVEKYCDVMLATKDIEDVIRALDLLGPVAQLLKSSIYYGTADSTSQLSGEEREQAFSVLRRIIGLCDRVLFHSTLEPTRVKPYQEMKARIAANIQREAELQRKKSKETSGKSEKEPAVAATAPVAPGHSTEPAARKPTQVRPNAKKPVTRGESKTSERAGGFGDRTAAFSAKPTRSVARSGDDQPKRWKKPERTLSGPRDALAEAGF